MKRAYSVLNLREAGQSKNADGRPVLLLTGRATSPRVDRYGDIIESTGAVFQLPMPALYQHDSRMPVGSVTRAEVTPEGIDVELELELPMDSDPPALRDRLAMAAAEVGRKLIRGLSIGFNPLEWSVMDDGGYRFIRWDWIELSLVTIPANVDGTITAVRDFDLQASQAAPGRTARPAGRDSSNSPGDTGTKASKGREGKRMNIAEQIQAFENQRAAKNARLLELMNTASSESRSLDDAEAEEYEGLEADLQQIDQHLVRLRNVEKLQRDAAKPVDTDAASQAREFSGQQRAAGRGSISVQANVPKGTGFTRYAMALAATKGNLSAAVEYARARWQDQTPEVVQVLRAAVAAGTTTDATWAGPLVEYQTLASEFIELLRPETIIGRIPDLRRVPFNVRMPGQTTGGSYGWVGEGLGKPVTSLAFNDVKLEWAKAAGIIVLTEELVRVSSPAAEEIVRGEMISGIAQFLDEQFVEPTVAAVPNESPASITNGVTPIPASGTDGNAFRADFKSAMDTFLAANKSPMAMYMVMTPRTALGLALMQNPLGQPEFPDITVNGGSLLGFPVITSESVPTDSSGSIIIMMKASDIFFADDGQVVLDVSREASLKMSTTPDESDAGDLVSLWQNNLVGLRAERWINWKKRRPTAVTYISGANYGAPSS